MTEIFETHAHYDDERFNPDRDSLLNSLPHQGVTRIVNIACDIDSIKASVQLAEAFSFVYATVGIHPHEARTMNEDVLNWMENLCAHEKVVAVGEIGLDFYYDHSPRDVQREWFAKQLDLTARVNLPVVIHSREAAQEVFDMITKSSVRRGIIHSYSGSAQMALDYVKLGFHLGIGGVVTFDKTKKLPEVVAAVPLERLVVETDAPYLTPVPNRGKRNDSSNLVYILQKIAEIKGITLEDAAQATFENAVKVYGL